ncbi:hypothetical protein ACFQAV_11785 [Companilactobacillus huachuanensis]|uniref:DUF2334 domain-containing protein n=1 Tax=Companilactobacillus huachuanensis TaxID=2559914 RepID=A0ABW1RQ29_9LACO|nr:hypothetical protein [Companilactobacillus huachuanensis]
MMKNRLLTYILIIGILFSSLLSMPTNRVKAATQERVLLVYDSENDVEQSGKQIDALQRILTSLNLPVKTISQNNYKSGMLKNYSGVITMINWRQVGLTNKVFIHDREKFSGIRLHIGDNLTANEAAQLGGHARRIYQQQFILKINQDEQLLPFSETITVLDGLSNQVQKVGILATQEKNQKSYPYGIINGQNGYLPYFNSGGLSSLAASQMIAKLFGKNDTYQPMLTITNVTPYSDLKILDALSLYCYQKEIPFAISASSVSDNTQMKAFTRYTTVLNSIENRGGVIFAQMPIVGAPPISSGSELSQIVSSYMVSLARENVYPIGISSFGYWNQDEILRDNALKKANNLILLPNEKVVYVKQDNNALSTKKSFYAMSVSSLNKVKKSYDMSFSMPTALTVSLPDSKVGMHDLEQEINGLQLNWFDPVNLNTTVKTGTSLMRYRNGDYYMNGKKEDIQNTQNTNNIPIFATKQEPLFSNFFHLQGNILMGFFIIVLLILIIFTLLGRKIYKNMFKR